MTTLRTFTVAGVDAEPAIAVPAVVRALLQAAQHRPMQQTSIHTCAVCAGPLIVIHDVLARATSGGRLVAGLLRRPTRLLSDRTADRRCRAWRVTTSGQRDPSSGSHLRRRPRATLHTIDTHRRLTDGQQNDVGDGSDTANNLLDAVGQLGNQVAATATSGADRRPLTSRLPVSARRIGAA
jgi:hypothetical protein